MIEPSLSFAGEDQREDLPDVLATVETTAMSQPRSPSRVQTSDAPALRTIWPPSLASCTTRFERPTEVRVDRIGAVGDGRLVGRGRVLELSKSNGKSPDGT